MAQLGASFGQLFENAIECDVQCGSSQFTQGLLDMALGSRPGRLGVVEGFAPGGSQVQAPRTPVAPVGFDRHQPLALEVEGCA